MGAEASIPLTPVKPGFSTMSITFGLGDCITVLHLDSAGLSAVAQAIKDTWKDGIQAEKSQCGTGWSFKLIGYPFGTFNSKLYHQAWKMVMRILQKLHKIGYEVVASGVLGTIHSDKSTLFFKKAALQETAESAQSPRLLCVSFNSLDKIQFTNLPSQLFNPIKDTVRTSWSLGIQSVHAENDVLQFKLAGNPWSATNNKESIMAKMFLQAIFATLYRYQWVYHINVNLNTNQDCLIFQYDCGLNTCESPQFCMIGFGQGDRLRLINASNDITNVIRTVIEANWNPGRIQEESEFHGSHEFKISGNPWNSVRDESARARYLMIRIFQEMLQQGWHNVAGFNLNQVHTDRVVLLFQKQEPANYPMFCIAPHDIDKFWLINMPAELVSLFKRILTSRWSSGIKSEKELLLHFGTVYKLTLSGTPWKGGKSNSHIHAQSFICNIIEEFFQLGWQLMLCADMTSRIVADPEYLLDVYSFWFAYNPTHMPQPSAPSHEFNAQSCHGTIGAPPSYSESPPSYSEATGWNQYGGKE